MGRADSWRSVIPAVSTRPGLRFAAGEAGIQACTSVPTFFLRFQARAGSRPGRRPTFLFAQESRQRSAPRLPGPSGCPRCGRPAGPVAKLAGRCAVVVGQRDRTSPGEPPSLGGSEGNEKRRAREIAPTTKPVPPPYRFEKGFSTVSTYEITGRRGLSRRSGGVKR